MGGWTNSDFKRRRERGGGDRGWRKARANKKMVEVNWMMPMRRKGSISIQVVHMQPAYPSIRRWKRLFRMWKNCTRTTCAYLSQNYVCLGCVAKNIRPTPKQKPFVVSNWQPTKLWKLLVLIFFLVNNSWKFIAKQPKKNMIVFVCVLLSDTAEYGNASNAGEENEMNGEMMKSWSGCTNICACFQW